MRAALLQNATGTDHFMGVAEALRSMGARVDEWGPEAPPIGTLRGVDVLLLADALSPKSLRAIRTARRDGAATLLVMDGVTDCRNTFMNSRAGPSFLRPAPVDAIACAGPVDELALRLLGNHAFATGLPRLASVPPASGASEASSILVATARNPVFHPDERQPLLCALRRVKLAAEAVGARILWRLTDDLDSDLGVTNEPGSLWGCIDRAAAVLTTPSTLVIESMRRRRPTMLLLPVAYPLWQWADAVLVSDSAPAHSIADPAPDITSRVRALAEQVSGGTMPMFNQDHEAALRFLLSGDSAHERANPLRAMLAPVESAAREVAQLAVRLARARTPTAGSCAPVPSVAGVPRRVAPSRKPRVVSCVQCDESCVGGVTTWSRRLGRAFRDMDLPFEVRTLIVATSPRSPWDAGFPVSNDGLTDLCMVDPTVDHLSMVETVRTAIENLNPSIVMPNYADLCFAAATQLVPRGVRTVAVAHTDDAYYKRALSLYCRWSAAVGVSQACMRWLLPMAAGRPCEQIVYGVPVSDSSRPGREHGPLELAYIGRMDEPQKRVSDLLRLLTELDRFGTPHRLHVVGDGPELARWTKGLESLRLPADRVRMHGRRDPEWVQALLPTIDALVLVSNYEGASISMLEAMGHGVVPVVTRVSSGVSEWVIDGETGRTVDIGDMHAMASAIDELARDRARLRDMGDRARRRVAGSADIGTMAQRYAALFTRCLSEPLPAGPSDLGLRLDDRWRWSRATSDDPAASDRLVLHRLHEAGYTRVAMNEPAPGCDAVLVSAGWTAADAAAIASWRAMGLGVAVSPGLLDDPPVHVALRRLNDAAQRGRARIAVYGAGRHTRRIADVFSAGLPIVAIMDDQPSDAGTLFGLPVLRPAEAIERLQIDCVLLSSDAHEAALWQRMQPWRSKGVEVIALYGQYEPADEAATFSPGRASTT